MYVVITNNNTGGDAKAHVGDEVELDFVNGGWVILRYDNGTSTSWRIQRVLEIHKAEERPR